MNRRASLGLLPWVFPAMLLVGALDVLAGGRDLTAHFAQLQVAAPLPRPALVAWAQRATSLLLLLAAIEQVVNHLALRLPTRSPGLLVAFVGYWLGTIAAPAALGAHPQASHELLYAPAAGIATCLASPGQWDRILRLSRDTLVGLMAAGLGLALVRPALVMDFSYAEGLLPGVPRFAGLATHPVTQGLLALLALLLLWARPYPRRGLQWAAVALALGVLVIAQSKTAWVACLVCALAMAGVRHGASLWRRIADPRRQGFGIAVCAGLATAVAASALAVLSGEAGARLDHLLASEQGAQLVTLTGRDRIWAAAAQEWRAHPVFGYGLSLWDPAYRASIGLPNATHAHNQFLDDAARAGSVGALALVAYGLVLAAFSLRRARASQGLALALFLVIALRSVSEVPLLLRGTDTELFSHLLLLATLAACGPARPARATARPSAHPASTRQGAPA